MSAFDPKAFLRDVVRQDADALRGHFAPDAVICWHDTGEAFTVCEYIRANCEYPGAWEGAVKRVEAADSGLVVVASKVWDDEAAHHVVSFVQVRGGKIVRLDEYWGDVGEPPAWRKAMGVGRRGLG